MAASIQSIRRRNKIRNVARVTIRYGDESIQMAISYRGRFDGVVRLPGAVPPGSVVTFTAIFDPHYWT